MLVILDTSVKRLNRLKISLFILEGNLGQNILPKLGSLSLNEWRQLCNKLASFMLYLTSSFIYIFLLEILNQQWGSLDKMQSSDIFWLVWWVDIRNWAKPILDNHRPFSAPWHTQKLHVYFSLKDQIMCSHSKGLDWWGKLDSWFMH